MVRRERQARSSGRALSGGKSDENNGSRRHKPDYMLLILSLLLLSIGVIIIYAIGPALAVLYESSTNTFINRQVIAIGLSLIAFVIAANIPIALWKQLYKPALIAAGIMTLIALIMPVNPDYPAHRWVRLGGFSFQSVELLKFALLLWLAVFLGKYMRDGGAKSVHNTAVFKPLLIALGVIGIIVAGVQSDLGSTGVIVAMMAAMAFVAGLPMKRIMAFGGIIVIGLVLAVATSPYRQDRVATFLNPEADCQDSGYQACHAHIAVGSGGIIGQGLGNGVQAYGYLPKAENDAIFAIYAEKFGFIGVCVLIGIFVGFFARMRRIAERSTDPFSRLVVVGVLVWLSVQAIMNIAAMLGLLPLKGITLPLVSYGGTSVVFVMIALGLVFQISRYSQHRVSLGNSSHGDEHENRNDRRRVRGAYHPNSGSRA